MENEQNYQKYHHKITNLASWKVGNEQKHQKYQGKKGGIHYRPVWKMYKDRSPYYTYTFFPYLVKYPGFLVEVELVAGSKIRDSVMGGEYTCKVIPSKLSGAFTR